MSKESRNKRKTHQNGLINESNENLGLDADGSSQDFSIYNNLNNDNDRISGNPDGEDDQRNTKEPPGHSLLDDK